MITTFFPIAWAPFNRNDIIKLVNASIRSVWQYPYTHTYGISHSRITEKFMTKNGSTFATTKKAPEKWKIMRMNKPDQQRANNNNCTICFDVAFFLFRLSVAIFVQFRKRNGLSSLEMYVTYVIYARIHVQWAQHRSRRSDYVCRFICVCVCNAYMFYAIALTRGDINKIMDVSLCECESRHQIKAFEKKIF